MSEPSNGFRYIQRDKVLLQLLAGLLGKGTGLRVSAKAGVTLAMVVHGKATVQDIFSHLFTVSSDIVATLTTPYLDFFCKYCSYQNLLVPEL